MAEPGQEIKLGCVTPNWPDTGQEGLEVLGVGGS